MATALVHFNHTEKNNLTGWADMRTSKWKPNYGDMLVCAAILRQLDLDETRRVGFAYELSEPVERAIIRGSTYLHNKLDFDGVNKTLDSIDAPTAIVGLGAQNPTQDVSFLDGNQGARDFIARLNERSQSISVRGTFSAAVVERLGGKNIRVTGCPSLFYTLECPRVEIPHMLRLSKRRLGVSLHTGLTKSIFCRSPERARRMHGWVIAYALENATNVSLFEQGVPREYKVSDRELDFAERLECAEAIIADIEAENLFTAHDLIARMVSVKSIEEWLSKVADLDAIVGFRFHGNMVALLQGAPCYYYVYDSRLKEFCDLYGLPYQDVDEDWKEPVSAMLAHDWEMTNARMSACHDELKTFYRENGFTSRL